MALPAEKQSTVWIYCDYCNEEWDESEFTSQGKGRKRNICNVCFNERYPRCKCSECGKETRAISGVCATCRKKNPQ